MPRSPPYSQKIGAHEIVWGSGWYRAGKGRRGRLDAAVLSCFPSCVYHVCYHVKSIMFSWRVSPFGALSSTGGEHVVVSISGVKRCAHRNRRRPRDRTLTKRSRSDDASKGHRECSSRAGGQDQWQGTYSLFAGGKRRTQNDKRLKRRLHGYRLAAFPRATS